LKAKDEKDIKDADYLLEGIACYHPELDDLEKDINNLDNDRAECFGEFNPELPKSIKEERNKRNAGKKPKPTDSDKPEDMYYKCHVNCKYKKRIQDLLKTLRDINQKRRDLMEKYAALK